MASAPRVRRELYVVILKSCFPNGAIDSRADLERLQSLYLGMREHTEPCMMS